MKQQAASRYEQKLTKIRASLTKKGGTKQEEKVNRRIGRAQQKYPSVQSNYVVELKCRDNIATDLVWIKKEENKANNIEKESDTNFVEINKNNLLTETKEQIYTSSIVLACNGCALQITDGFNQVTLKNILAVVKEL